MEAKRDFIQDGESTKHCGLFIGGACGRMQHTSSNKDLLYMYTLIQMLLSKLTCHCIEHTQRQESIWGENKPG